MNSINKILASLLLLVMVVATGCEDDSADFGGPYQLVIVGSTGVNPESTKTYSLGNVENPDSYTWSVAEGPATIIGSSQGSSVQLEFGNVGKVVLQVSGPNQVGQQVITVRTVSPSAKSVLSGNNSNLTSVLRAGQQDTVFIDFAAPLASMPTVEIDQYATYQGGSISELMQLENGDYYVLYTAGGGNGTPVLKIRDLVATEGYGGAELDSAMVNLYTVDNIAPIADINYSQELAKNGSEVTISVNFSENVMPIETDTLIIKLNGAGINLTDTLKPTSNNRVYTYTFEVDTQDSGEVSVSLENVSDRGGNLLAAVNNATELVIDNVPPRIISTSSTDQGTNARITAGTDERAWVMYAIVDQDDTAPTNLREFQLLDAKASGTLQTTGIFDTSSQSVLIGSGSYMVYYIAMDQAGNYSTVSQSSLEMVD